MEVFFTTFGARLPHPLFVDIQPLLLDQDLLKQQVPPSPNSTSSLAIFSSRGHGSQHGGHGSHLESHVPHHWVDIVLQSANPPSSNYWRSCQVCQNFIHSVRPCKRRFNHSYNVADLPKSFAAMQFSDCTSPAWYPNTSASSYKHPIKAIFLHTHSTYKSCVVSNYKCFLRRPTKAIFSIHNPCTSLAWYPNSSASSYNTQSSRSSPYTTLH